MYTKSQCWLPVVIASSFLLVNGEELIAGELNAFTNSPTLSEVIDLNDRGIILGRHEIEQSGVLSMEYYLRVNGVDRHVPIPSTFTHVEALTLSDRGQVAGFATRPVGHPQGSQRAMLWDITRPTPDLLPLPVGFRGSCAFDVTQDGSHVSGYVVGSDPPRQRPCIWRRRQVGWDVEMLPVRDPFNPLLTSAHVKISGRGDVVAASLVVGTTAAGTRKYGLFVWMRDDSGQWRSQQLTDQAVHLGDVNDAGVVVGRVLSDQGKHQIFIYHPGQGARVVPLPPGRGGAYATDVNRHGQVVGVIEDPPGPEGSLFGFLWRDGTLSELPFGVVAVASTANAITDQGRVGGMIAQHTKADEDQPAASYVLQIPTP